MPKLRDFDQELLDRVDQLERSLTHKLNSFRILFVIEHRDDAIMFAREIERIIHNYTGTNLQDGVL